MVRQRTLSPKPLLDEPSLRSFLIGHGCKPTHMGRIWKYMLANPDCPLDEIPQIPDKIRQPLKAEFALTTSTVVETLESEIDGTMKLLVRMQDGAEVEAVLIHHTGEAEHPDARQADRCGARDTLCISSQVGCQLGCTFCATGTLGLQGNLWAGEIQEQLLHARRLRTVNNVVFMGMGEPLENFAGVTSAVHGLVDPFRFGLAPSSVTVSTVGIIGNMYKLMDALPKIRLAVSLHAPNQELREQIVPIARTYKLNQLMQALDDYASRITNGGTRRGTVMVSYVLLEGVNDSDECAHQLIALLRGKPVMVNLIPYNPFDGNAHGHRCPTPERVDAFLQMLVQADIRVFERRHHGRDIAAACGQLAKLGKGTPPPGDIEVCSCVLAKEKVKGGAEGQDVAYKGRVRAQPPRAQNEEGAPPEVEGNWRRVAVMGAVAAVAGLVVTGLLRRRRGWAG